MTAVQPSKLPTNSGLSSWIAAARPRTLSLSIVPVVVGAALAWAVAGKIQWGALLAVLCASVLVQIGTNLYNDAADARRGGDGPDRVGPPRVTAQGLLTAAAVTRADSTPSMLVVGQSWFLSFWRSCPAGPTPAVHGRLPTRLSAKFS